MKREAPAAARNREPIADVLADELPASGTVLELASGTGEHVIHFAARFPGLHWQPSDPDAEARDSIAAWSVDAGLANIAAPLELDASATDWPLDHADAIVCINMVHISPVAATEGLVRAASRILPEGAPLILYGPYLEGGVETVESNIAFDGWLKQRNPEFGLRRAEWLDELAGAQGLVRTRRVAMPANNIVLVYRKS
jgi:SAM-dependent methyltransferase